MASSLFFLEFILPSISDDGVEMFRSLLDIISLPCSGADEMLNHHYQSCLLELGGHDEVKGQMTK